MTFDSPLQMPEEAKELDIELRQITKDKNEAIRGQEFEKVKKKANENFQVSRLALTFIL